MGSICANWKSIDTVSTKPASEAPTTSQIDHRQRHKTIEAVLREDKRKQALIFRLLLLGAGESGKSTVVKQLRILHASGFSKTEIAREQSVISENMISAMIAMIDALEQLEIARDFEPDPQFEADVKFVRAIKGAWENGTRLEPGEWAAMKRLWNHDVIRACFKRANEYQLNDSTQYFFDEIDRIASPTYSPTEQDILRARVRTTGVVELSLPLRSLDVRIIDVGGQRSERRKWVHCFENVNSIIFVASMSEYNQVLFEDHSVNRMHESLRLFESVVNSRWFAKSHTILFLNKKDLFREKIHHHSITSAFPEYAGSSTFEATSDYIEQQYMKRKLDQSRQLYCHFTCATDTSSIQMVMNACFDMIFTEVAKGGGLM